jgi:predicted DNA-binding transcriptional regulator AlpA
MSTVEQSGTDSNSPLLVDLKSVAMLLGRSTRSITRDDHEGRLPRPIMLGGSKRWRLKELRQWVRAGCPSREVWESCRNKGAESSLTH